jgi:hypothetical protein
VIYNPITSKVIYNTLFETTTELKGIVSVSNLSGLRLNIRYGSNTILVPHEKDVLL